MKTEWSTMFESYTRRTAGRLWMEVFKGSNPEHPGWVANVGIAATIIAAENAADADGAKLAACRLARKVLEAALSDLGDDGQQEKGE